MAGESRAGRQVDDLRRREFFTDLDRGRIGIYPICPALAVESQRRNDRDNSLVEQKAQGLDVHPFDPACELVVRSAKNSGRMGDDRVDVGCPQVHGGQTFHDLVGQANCRIDADL